jgi:hypothetical protein
MANKRERSRFQLRPAWNGRFEIIEEIVPKWSSEVRSTFDSEAEAMRAIRKRRADEQRKRRLLQEPNAVKRFLGLYCFYAEGCKVRFAELWNRFQSTRRLGDHWTKQGLRKALPNKYPSGKSTGGHLYVGNISFREPDPFDASGPRFAAVDGKLKIES